MNLVARTKERFDKGKIDEMSLSDYLDLIKTDKTSYANAAESYWRTYNRRFFY